MKTKKTQILAIAMMIMMSVCSTRSYSAIFNVSASDFSFSPANINVSVGDTVKWTWLNGSHTTTCNGTAGTTRPSGAAAWNSPLTSGTPTFSYIVTVAGSYHYVCTPHAPSMSGNINAVASSITQLTELVRGFELSQNYPNPFNPSTNIKFSVPNSSFVILKIYNNSGREVETIVNEKLNAGSYEVDWKPANLTSGVYYYRIQADGFIQTRKMLLLK